MLESRPIRLAVNLCVTGAMLLPTSAFPAAMAATCDAPATGEAKCNSCGRCSVGESGGLCKCCCNQRSDRVAEQISPERQACCERSSAAPRAEEEPAVVGWGICLCNQQPQPATPAPPNSSAAGQLIQLLLTAAAIDDLPAADPATSYSASGHSAPPSLLPRDSQRRLCVWRI